MGRYAFDPASWIIKHLEKGESVRKLIIISCLFCLGYLFTPKTTFALNDFATRSNLAGVVRSFGFDCLEATGDCSDLQLDTKEAVSPYLEYLPSESSAIVDHDVKASGAGSLRFNIAPGSKDNCSGDFFMNFSDDLQTQFGEGQEFYVQWRQMFSDNMLSTNFGGDGFKQAIVGEGDRTGYSAPGCSEIEVVMYNSYFRGFPHGYNNCGKWIEFQEAIKLPRWANYRYDYKLQNAINSTYCQELSAPPDYCLDELNKPTPYCLWSNNKGGQIFGHPPCFLYTANNEWMTFEIHIKIGHWNQPDSTIEFWGAHEGDPLNLFIKMTNYTIYKNRRSAAKYGKVYLTPYMTGKDTSTPASDAYTWYDELIISTNWIPGPDDPPYPPAN